uniref:Uncharacterized protein n=1 Tax=Malurus cyaneus samueli TaxID=2593467 RepID=A0A8C5TVC6_9PASS
MRSAGTGCPAARPRPRVSVFHVKLTESALRLRELPGCKVRGWRAWGEPGTAPPRAATRPPGRSPAGGTGGDEGS